MIRYIFFTTLMVCFLLAAVVTASAYTIGNDMWEVSSVQVNYNSFNSSWKTATYNAMNAWNNVGTDISLVNKTIIDHVNVSTSSAFPNNGVLANESGTHGKYNSTSGKWVKISSLILVNTDYTWSTSSACPSGSYDLQSVMTHELGHTLCIGHSSYTNAVMYSITDSGTTWKRILSADDKNALRAIYT